MHPSGFALGIHASILHTNLGSLRDALRSYSISKLISTTFATNHYLETITLSQALKSLASSIFTYQHDLDPLGPWSPVKVSSILNSAHLEMDMMALNLWVWSTKMGVSAKIFVRASPTHYQAPSYVNSWIYPGGNTICHMLQMLLFMNKSCIIV